MKQKINYLKQARGFFLTLIFAVVVLIVTVNAVKISQHNIVGKAFYNPIQVYGTIEPALPDGTKISFKAGDVEIASTVLNNSMYGYDPKLFFKIDDETTLKREGYREGDVVKFYIEDIEIAEFSYCAPGMNKKDINIPTSKRVEVSTKTAKADIERTCRPVLQCGEWSECVNNIQTRSCIDAFECGTEEGKPEEARECRIEPVVEEPLGIMDFITTEWILTVSLFIILTVSLIFLIRKAIWIHKIRKYTKRKGTVKKKR